MVSQPWRWDKTNPRSQGQLIWTVCPGIQSEYCPCICDSLRTDAVCYCLYKTVSGDQKESEPPWSSFSYTLGARLFILDCTAMVWHQILVAAQGFCWTDDIIIRSMYMWCTCKSVFPVFLLSPLKCELWVGRHCGQSHRKPRRQRTSRPVCVLEEALPPQMQQEQLLNICHVKAVKQNKQKEKSREQKE